MSFTVDVRIIGGCLPVFAVPCGVFSVLEESVSMLFVHRGAKKFRVGTSLGPVLVVGRVVAFYAVLAVSCEFCLLEAFFLLGWWSCAVCGFAFLCAGISLEPAKKFRVGTSLGPVLFVGRVVAFFAVLAVSCEFCLLEAFFLLG
jgi:hypothetical protein